MSPALPLFVYGTLRKGERGHALLGGAPCLGLAKTPPRYTLIRMSWYPAMLAGGSSRVVGELYTVAGRQVPAAHGRPAESLLARLDDYEDCPTLYERATIELADGRRALAYLLRPEHGRGRPRITSGDWCRP